MKERQQINDEILWKGKQINTLDSLFDKEIDKIKLADLIEIGSLQEIQDAFSSLMNVASIITDENGNQITKESGFQKFCTNFIHYSNHNFGLCFQRDKDIWNYYNNDIQFQDCSCGFLQDACAFIKCEERVIGKWFIGQVRFEEPDFVKLKQFAQNYNLDENDFVNAYLDIPFVKSADLAKIAKLLNIVVKNISSKAYSEFKNRKLLSIHKDIGIKLKNDYDNSINLNTIINKIANSKAIQDGNFKSTSKIIIDSAIENLNIENAEIYLFSSSTNQFKCFYSKNNFDINKNCKSLNSSQIQSIINEIGNNDFIIKSEHNNNFRRDSNFLKNNQESLFELDTVESKSYFFAKIKTSKNPIGLLVLYKNNYTDDWNQNEINFCKQLANQFSFCIFNKQRQKFLKIITQQQFHFKLINKNLRDIIWEYDNQFNCLFISESVFQNIGYTPDEFKKLKITDYLTKKSVNFLYELLEKFNHTLKNEGENKDKLITHTGIEIIKKDGNIFFGEISFTYLVDESNQIQKIIGTTRDITEQKILMDERNSLVEELKQKNEIIQINLFQKDVLLNELEENNRKLQIANDSKNKFFSIIAHDLRSPLSGFIGMSEFLNKEFTELSLKEIKRFTKTIYETGKNMHHLLDDLLIWSSNQLGSISFKPTTEDLYIIINDLFLFFDENAQKKKITLKNFVTPNFFVSVDKNMIITIFRNLINNSIKFTENGGIFVNAHIKSNFVVCSVEDTGIGMDDSTLKKIFDEVGDISSQKGTAGEIGSGLGFQIIKEFVGRHNGKIWAESEIGVGTKVFFSIPYDVSF